LVFELIANACGKLVAQFNSQQFNKEAYLDLSKPYTYNWNNAQSTTKQDNQATTLLKKVAGTARAALGSVWIWSRNQ
jgi:hypothetical protein